MKLKRTLSDPEIEELRTEYACSGKTLRELGEQFGIPVSTVHAIVMWRRCKESPPAKVKTCPHCYRAL